MQILQNEGAMILRARNSELLILPNHTIALQEIKEARAFSHYFIHEALLNRPARKLFEAWLRKDQSVWPRLYRFVHEELKVPEETRKQMAEAVGKEESSADSAPIEEASAKPAKKKATAKKKAASKATSKKTKATTDKKKAVKKKTATTAAKKKKKVSKKV